MRITQFDFDLPPAAIARRAMAQRAQARLLVVDRHRREIGHYRVSDLPEVLAERTERFHLVMNDSRVVPSQVSAPSHGTEGEPLQLSFAMDAETGVWSLAGESSELIHPLGRRDLTARARSVTARHNGELFERWQTEATVTLPRYLQHLRAEFSEGVPDFYDNVYASRPGSVAPPSGGRNLSGAVLSELSSVGVTQTELTLHVGHVTFRRPKHVDLNQHEMEGERYRIWPSAAESLWRARSEGRRVVAVGTTSTRALEHSAQLGGPSLEGETAVADIFIRPGHRFQWVDGLLTGFHGPRTTLFVMVCAFGGRDSILEAYAQALERGYRWYTLGDSMLIL